MSEVELEKLYKKARKMDARCLRHFITHVGLRGETGVTGEGKLEWTICLLRSSANMLEAIARKSVKTAILLAVLAAVVMVGVGASVAGAEVKLVEGVLEQKTDQGIVVRCREIPYNPPPSMSGPKAKGNQARLAAYNKRYGEIQAGRAKGLVMLQGVAGVEKMAQGDGVKVEATESGVIDKYAVSGDTYHESLKLYVVAPSPAPPKP
jgi:hypothetical protein